VTGVTGLTFEFGFQLGGGGSGAVGWEVPPEPVEPPPPAGGLTLGIWIGVEPAFGGGFGAGTSGAGPAEAAPLGALLGEFGAGPPAPVPVAGVVGDAAAPAEAGAAGRALDPPSSGADDPPPRPELDPENPPPELPPENPPPEPDPGKLI